jgi:hypothetical protein
MKPLSYIEQTKAGLEIELLATGVESKTHHGMMQQRKVPAHNTWHGGKKSHDKFSRCKDI